MSEECRALLKVVYDRSAASNASRNVLRRMLDEDMSLAMSAEPPELPPRLDYTQCHTHGNTDQLCTNLCNLPEVKGSFRPEEKKARLIKNMAPRTQRVEHEHLQPQLLLPHFAPQPLNAWVNANTRSSWPTACRLAIDRSHSSSRSSSKPRCLI